LRDGSRPWNGHALPRPPLLKLCRPCGHSGLIATTAERLRCFGRLGALAAVSRCQAFWALRPQPPRPGAGMLGGQHAPWWSAWREGELTRLWQSHQRWVFRACSWDVGGGEAAGSGCWGPQHRRRMLLHRTAIKRRAGIYLMTTQGAGFTSDSVSA